ncbi:MAG: TIM barrel protein, partial [Clostridia bacterium]
MIKFGPAGASNSFQEDGFKHTIDIPLWLKGKQLDCFEYSFGKGVRITSETAQNIGKEFAKYNIEISAHAPYYINFANNDPQKAQNNIGYLLDTLKALDWFGGNRCVFHSGSPLKMTRKEAIDNAKINLNCA